MDCLTDEWIERTVNEAFAKSMPFDEMIERFNQNPPEDVKRIRNEIEYLKGIEAIFAGRVK